MGQTKYAAGTKCPTTAMYLPLQADGTPVDNAAPQKVSKGEIFPTTPSGVSSWIWHATAPEWRGKHTRGLVASLLLGIVGPWLLMWFFDWIGWQANWRIIWPWLVTAGAMVVLLGTMASALTGRAIGCIINEQNRMSLSRVQWLLWTVLVLSAFVTAVIGNMYMGKGWGTDALAIALPEQLWLAMGISTVSLVGSGLIVTNKQKKEPTDDAAAKFAVASGKITAQQLAAAKITQAQLDAKATAQALTSGGATTPAAAKAALERDQAAAQLAVAPAVQEVKTNELNGVLAKNASPRDANPSDLVSGEEMGNKGVLVPTRFFNLVMTIILVAIYAVNLGYLILTEWHTGITSFPELGTASATLLTLTHAAYLADKVPDKEEVKP